MSYCKLLTLLLIISSIFSVDYALNMEEIIGGHPALQSDFKYHAGIFGKYNHNHVVHLLCSAGIISNFLLISSAHCFLHAKHQLKKFTFYASVGIDRLVAKELLLYDIEEIYTYHYSEFWVEHNLGITKLKQSLYLENRPELAALDIPDADEIFEGEVGIVAGFGISSIHDLRQKRLIITSKKNIFLKFANVNIINTTEITDSSELICDEVLKYFTELCGKILPNDMYDYRGICMGDDGGPLVINMKVIGVVSRRRLDCDDTVYGTVYTKVSKFKRFIDGLLNGNPIDGTNTFENPRHAASHK